MVFLVTVFPTADWVPLTRNSIPAGFDVTVFFVTRLPVAKMLIRIPARMACRHEVVFHGVVGPREDQNANAIPGERVLPDHVIGRHAPDHDPPAPVVPEVVVPDRVAAAAGLKIDAVDVLDEFVPLDHDPGRRVGEHTRPEVPDGAPEDGDIGPSGDVDPGAGAGAGDRVTVQVDPDVVGPDDETVAGAGEIVIQFQVLGDRDAAELIGWMRCRHGSVGDRSQKERLPEVALLFAQPLVLANRNIQDEVLAGSSSRVLEGGPVDSAVMTSTVITIAVIVAIVRPMSSIPPATVRVA